MTALWDVPLALRETVDRPSLAEIAQIVFALLRTRSDAVLFGAYGVNAYVDPPRMTEDIDVLSTDAAGLAEEVRSSLTERFRIAVRVRVVADGRGFRVYQLRQPRNRHLVDVRQVDEVPEWNRIDGVRVVRAPALFVMKLESYAARKRTPKGITDKVDIVRMLQAYPEFPDRGPVALLLARAPQAARDALDEIQSEGYGPDDDTW